MPRGRGRGRSSSIVQNCVNQDIVDFLKEWLEDSAARQNPRAIPSGTPQYLGWPSDSVRRSLPRAIVGLRTWPTRISNAESAKEVPGIGPYLAEKIREFLANSGGVGQNFANRVTQNISIATPEGSGRGTGRGRGRGAGRDDLAEVSDDDDEAHVSRDNCVEDASGIVSSSVVRALSGVATGRQGAARGGATVDDSEEGNVGVRTDRDAMERLLRGNMGHRFNESSQNQAGSMMPALRGGGRGRRRGRGGRGRGRGIVDGDDAQDEADNVSSAAAASPVVRGRGRGRARGAGRGKSSKKYEPRYRSGAYAMLIALYRAQREGRVPMSKKDLIREATPLADEPLEPRPGGYSETNRYTGYTAMNQTLIPKELVTKASNPVMFTLSASGSLLAADLHARNEEAEGRAVHVYEPTSVLAGPSSLDRAQVTALLTRGEYQDDAAEWGEPPIARGNAPGGAEDLPREPFRASDTVYQPIQARPVVTRSKRDIELAADAGYALVSEGFEATLVVERVKNLVTSVGNLPGNKESFCDVIRRQMRTACRQPGTPFNTLGAGLAKATLERDLTVTVLETPAPRHRNEARLSGKRPSLVDDAAIAPKRPIAAGPSRGDGERTVGGSYRTRPKRPRNASDWVAMATDVVLDLAKEGHPVEFCFQVLEDVTANHEVESAGVLRAYMLDAFEDAGEEADHRPYSVGGTQRQATGASGDAIDSLRRSSPGHTPAYNQNETNPGVGGGPNGVGLHEARCSVDREHMRRAAESEACPAGARKSTSEAAAGVPPLSGNHSRAEDRSRPCPPELLRPSGLAPRVEPLALSYPISREVTGQASARGSTAEITLLLDNREIYGHGEAKAALLMQMADAMMRADLKVQNTVLPVGDALFVARLESGVDIVLDWIIERKTINDFVDSIADGRVKHQTFAMRQCGLSNKMLLLEGRMRELPNRAAQINRAPEELESILHDLHVCDGFYVHNTRTQRETVDTFVSMSRRLTKRFSWLSREELTNGRLTYQQWERKATMNARRLPIDQAFALQLCSVPGIGMQGAERVLQLGIDTPAKLREEYQKGADSPQKMEELLRSMAGENGRSSTRVLSKRASQLIFRLFTWDRYETELVGTNRHPRH